MTEIEAGYVVHQNSDFQLAEQVDSSGVKIAAPEKAGYELYLSHALKMLPLFGPKALQVHFSCLTKTKLMQWPDSNLI